MKQLLLLLFSVSFVLPISGCGEPTYDIPEVSKEDSEREAERMKKEIEAEMRKNMGGGQRN